MRWTLFEGWLDYAGLFPPAGLDMAAAAARFVDAKRGPHAWTLGRFVVPLARVDELEACIQEFDPHGDPWPLSLLIGRNFAAASKQLDEWGSQGARRFKVETLEAVLLEASDLDTSFDPELTVYYEVDSGVGMDERLEWLSRAEIGATAAAKIRTGSVHADEIPIVDRVASFLIECDYAKLAYKATAGLHHPVCGDYPLTYEADAAYGRMFGFFNVFLAAAGVQAGLPSGQIIELLQETQSPQVADGKLVFAGHSFTNEQLAQTRRERLHSFGSCSFHEPIESLENLELL